MKITPEQMAASGSEHAHQTALFMWINDNKNEYPQLTRAFAIPNGGERHAAVAANLKAEGVKTGIPDIFLPLPKKNKHGCPFHGMFLELKIGRNTPSGEQLDWIDYFEKNGYYCAVAYGWEAARNKLIEYLEA